MALLAPADAIAKLTSSKVYKPSVHYSMTKTPDFDKYNEQVPAADQDDLICLAQMLWGEARGVPSKDHQAAVIWCVFNRIDDPRWPDTITEVCIPSQFNGYSLNNPVDPELMEIVVDVYSRYYREKAGAVNVGRVLPREYVFFHGDDFENWFRINYEHDGNYWEWSLPSPY